MIPRRMRVSSVQNRLLSHHELTHLVKSSVCVIVAEASDFGETLRRYQAIYTAHGIAAPVRFPDSVFHSIGLAAHQIVAPAVSPSLSANIIALRAKLLPAFNDADYAALAIADSLPEGLFFLYNECGLNCSLFNFSHALFYVDFV